MVFFEKKEKKYIQPFNLKRELRFLPAYIIILIWVLFTFILVGWIFAASFSTSSEISKGEVLKFASGLHFENYAIAWQTGNVSVYFMNSVIYSIISCFLLIIICAPAAYVLARYTFLGNKKIKSGLVMAMSIPNIMIILPLLNVITALKLNGTRFILIFLYVAINIPFTVTFLINFFNNLSRSYEEAAIIDGCTPTKAFWKVMFPLAQPGIITVGIFNFLAVWNEYFMSLVFASDESKRSVGVGLATMVNSLRQRGQMGALFAGVIIVFLPTFILYIFLSEKIIAGVTGGGVKG